MLEYMIVYGVMFGFIFLVSFISEKIGKKMREDAAYMHYVDEHRDEKTKYSDRVGDAAGIGGMAGMNSRAFTDFANASVMNKK